MIVIRSSGIEARSYINHLHEGGFIDYLFSKMGIYGCRGTAFTLHKCRSTSLSDHFLRWSSLKITSLGDILNLKTGVFSSFDTFGYQSCITKSSPATKMFSEAFKIIACAEKLCGIQHREKYFPSIPAFSLLGKHGSLTPYTVRLTYK